MAYSPTVTDSSNGYDDIAELFMSARDRTIGADVVRAWSARLARGARVLDVGCGFGVPITQTLVDEGFRVHAVDASPSMVRAFLARSFPQRPVNFSLVGFVMKFGGAFESLDCKLCGFATFRNRNTLQIQCCLLYAFSRDKLECT